MYNHVALPVINLHESEEFYELLGFSRLREWQKPDQELQAVVMQTADGFILELVYHPTNNFTPASPVVETRHIGIGVTNLPKILAELEEKKVKILKSITPGVTVKEFAFVEDPNGNAIELVVEK